MSLQSVYLGYSSSSRERIVTQEGYDAIVQLVKQYQLCAKCRLPIDETDHLLVGLNLCLACLLKRQTHLTFIGVQEEHDDGDITYSYVDAEGIVYTSRSNYSDEAKKDIALSIARAGFPVPETYKPFKAEEAVALNRSDWTIYGKLSSSVIVLDYNEHYGQRIRATFLSYKGGKTVELNKRNSTHKQLFERARSVVEATRDKQGNYHFDGHEFYQLYDSTLYPMIAQMEAAVYDVQLSFGNGRKRE